MPLEPCRNVSRGHACRCLLLTAVPDLHLKSNSGSNDMRAVNLTLMLQQECIRS